VFKARWPAAAILSNRREPGERPGPPPTVSP
jgi:hypothetical protein